MCGEFVRAVFRSPFVYLTARVFMCVSLLMCVCVCVCVFLQDALRAARVEEDCQIEEWGSVEAGHDLDQADYTTRIASAAVFLKLLQLK